MNYGKNKKCIMFVDETGSDDINNKDDFGIVGVIFKNTDILHNNNTPKLTNELKKLKLKCFNNDNIALHLVDIIRRRKQFTKYNKNVINNFICELPTFLNKLDMDIISVTINKKVFSYNIDMLKDIYSIAFSHLLESYYVYIKSKNITSAKIVLESRDDNKNLQVQKTFFNIYNHGTLYWNTNDDIRDKIKGFILAPKRDITYSSGLEIADLLCNPLTRVRCGKEELYNGKFIEKENYIIFNSIKDKIFNINNDYCNWGFKKIPILDCQLDYFNNNNLSLTEVAVTKQEI